MYPLKNLSTPTTWGQETTYSHQIYSLRDLESLLNNIWFRRFQSLVPADSRSQPGIALQQHLVPLGSRGSLHQHQDQWIASPRRHRCVQAHNSASDEKDARFSSGTQHFPAGFTTWTNSKDRRSQTKSPWKYHGRTRC